MFDPNKKYILTIQRDDATLTYTATNVELVGVLISFIDKKNQHMVFPIDSLLQAEEVKEK